MHSELVFSYYFRSNDKRMYLNIRELMKTKEGQKEICNMANTYYNARAEERKLNQSLSREPKELNSLRRGVYNISNQTVALTHNNKRKEFRLSVPKMRRGKLKTPIFDSKELSLPHLDPSCTSCISLSSIPD